MMGERRIEQPALFYEFSLDGHVPQDHLLRAIDRFVDLDGVRAHLAPFYSAIGRPSIAPELMIRMLLIGYRMGVRRERGLQASLAPGRARYPPPLEGELIRVAHGLAQWRRGAVPRPPDFASRGGQA